MRYEEFRPDSSVASHIAQYWLFEAGEIEGGRADHVIVPDGLVSVSAVFTPGAARPFAGVTGPSQKAHRVTIVSNQTIIGVRFQPGGASALLGFELASVAGAIVPLAHLAPNVEEAFLAAAWPAKERDWSLLLKFLADRAASAPEPDPAASAMARRLMETDGRAAIAAISKECGVSPRQARRRFATAIGLSPKAFARIRRVRRACADGFRTERSLLNVSLEAGFADQSHLSRNFQSVFDQPPSKIRAYIRRITHGDVFSA